MGKRDPTRDEEMRICRRHMDIGLSRGTSGMNEHLLHLLRSSG